jgi:DNA-directed RNA polymerase subunit RPC12/RpoP
MPANGEYGGKCPYCGKEADQLNNHVRMKSDADHGEQGAYPTEWDKESLRIDRTRQTDTDGSQSDADEPDPRAGSTQDRAGDVYLPGEDGEQDDGGGSDPADLFEDTEADAREYECGNCGHPLPYLGGEEREDGGMKCPECGERLFWSMMK